MSENVVMQDAPVVNTEETVAIIGEPVAAEPLSPEEVAEHEAASQAAEELSAKLGEEALKEEAKPKLRRDKGAKPKNRKEKRKERQAARQQQEKAQEEVQEVEEAVSEEALVTSRGQVRVQATAKVVTTLMKGSKKGACYLVVQGNSLHFLDKRGNEMHQPIQVAAGEGVTERLIEETLNVGAAMIAMGAKRAVVKRARKLALNDNTIVKVFTA
jgi:hypothetical protein